MLRRALKTSATVAQRANMVSAASMSTVDNIQTIGVVGAGQMGTGIGIVSLLNAKSKVRHVTYLTVSLDIVW